MAESSHHHHGHTHPYVPAAVIFGEFSPRESLHLGSNPVEAAMQDFIESEKLELCQKWTEDYVAVIFGTYAPRNTQQTRDGALPSGNNLERELEPLVEGISLNDILKDVSVSIQYIPHLHIHRKGEEKEHKTLKCGYYVGLDVASFTSGHVFAELSETYNYRPATVTSHGNGFHCDKKLLRKHSPNAFVPCARLHDDVDVHAIRRRLHVFGCGQIRKYAEDVFQLRNEHSPEGSSDEKEAFTELAELALDKSIKYNRICVAHVH